MGHDSHSVKPLLIFGALMELTVVVSRDNPANWSSSITILQTDCSSLGLLVLLNACLFLDDAYLTEG